MATSGSPYKRTADWNEQIIQKINELAEECEIDPLEEVDECHKLGKSDIQQAQDKLKEICDENTFGPIPDKWKVSTIQELEDAIAAGECCEEDCPTCDFQLDESVTVPTGSTGTFGDGWTSDDLANLVTTVFEKVDEMQEILDEVESPMCEDLKELRDQLAAATDPDEIESLQNQIEDKQKEIDDKVEEITPISDEIDSIVEDGYANISSQAGQGSQHDLTAMMDNIVQFNEPYLDKIKSDAKACRSFDVNECRLGARILFDVGAETDILLFTVPGGRFTPIPGYTAPITGPAYEITLKLLGTAPTCSEE